MRCSKDTYEHIHFFRSGLSPTPRDGSLQPIDSNDEHDRAGLRGCVRCSKDTYEHIHFFRSGLSPTPRDQSPTAHKISPTAPLINSYPPPPPPTPPHYIYVYFFFLLLFPLPPRAQSLACYSVVKLTRDLACGRNQYCWPPSIGNSPSWPWSTKRRSMISDEREKKQHF